VSTAELHIDIPGTSLGAPTRGRRAALGGAIALSILTAPGLGTAIDTRTDLTGVLNGTTLRGDVHLQGGHREGTRETLMRRIRAISGVSQRQWASILGVSHPTVGNWESRNPPDTNRLAAVLDVLEQARRFHGDVGTWLTSALPGIDERPLDLLASERYRAFRGALRAGITSTPAMSAEERRARIKSDMSWPVPETSAAPDGYV
jgi:DNA-binding transcriptional regulator YiaG